MILTRIKRLLIGEPLTSQFMMEARLPNWKALAVLSSDMLSSVAYATEEMLIPLAAFSVAAMAWSLPVAAAIGILLLIVTTSYRQTIRAYPNGGGAYVVVKENLGVYPGLVAGASLLVDYALTVAVSVAAGVAAVTSALPELAIYKVELGIGLILVLMFLNLRGMKESSSIFALPAYLFVFSLFGLLGIGAWKVMSGETAAVAPLVHEIYPEVPLFLILRAFSSGCVALTGIENFSNGLRFFRTPVAKNAKSTIAWTAGILAMLFLGVTFLAHVYGVVPRSDETAMSWLARSVVGESPFYFLIQGATALILFLAANNGYTGFPMLASLLAKDRFLPRQFASQGDKLVYSNSIIGLSIVAGGLVVIFQANTHYLIPLYAIGVFLSFTLSQSAMVLRLWRERKPGWVRSMCISAVGGGTTLVVLLVIAFTKFMHGAWMVILALPMIVLLFLRIHRHYLAVGKELSLIGQEAPPRLEKLQHTVIVPVSGLHRGVLDALRYAISISDDVRACYVELDPVATERMQEEWNKWAHEIPFVILKSPFRSVITPILEYIDDIERNTRKEMITVIIPEFVTARWWHRLLHNQTALLIRAALIFRRGKVVTSVRYYLKET